MINKLTLLICCLPLFGCSLLINNNPNLVSPSNISIICQNAKNNSKNCIENCQTSLKKQESVTVQSVNGEKQIQGMWSWRSKELNWIWIVGLYYANGNLIKIGCNPQTKRNVNYNILFHQFGHYWLETNYRLSNHLNQYDPCFNWSWIDDQLNNRTSIRGRDPDGYLYHIDFFIDETMILKTNKIDKFKSITLDWKNIKYLIN